MKQQAQEQEAGVEFERLPEGWSMEQIGSSSWELRGPDGAVVACPNSEREAIEMAWSRMPLHVFEIGPDTLIAHDVEDAWRLFERQTGLKRGDDDIGDDEPIQVPDDRPLKIQIEEGSPEAVTLTAAEWCQREGRGFLCSTEY